jgi:hypothetical protein
MVNEAALNHGTQLVPIDTVILAVIDMLERHADNYRDTDLEQIREVIYGDPFEVTNFPCLAVIPESGVTDRDVAGCDAAERTDLVRVRLYYESVDDETGAPYRPVTRTMDYLRALFLERRAALTCEGCRHGPYEVYPGAYFIATFIQEQRDGFSYLAVRGAELELTVKSYESTPLITFAEDA